MSDKIDTESGSKPGEEKQSAELSAVKRTKQNCTEAEKDNDESPSTFDSSPVEKALQNSVVLQKIFKFLSYKDLLTCRSVNRFWSSEAAHLIRQRPLLRIRLTPERAILVKIFQGKRIVFLTQSFSELLTKLGTCEQGYEIWLSIVDFSLLDWGQSKMFLRKFAKVICSLDLCNKSLDSATPIVLQQLLLRLPNLTSLTLTTFPEWWEDTKERVSLIWHHDILLPQIHTVSFCHPYFRSEHFLQILEELFEIMPNLKNVYQFPLDCIHLLTAGDKINPECIKSVNVSSLCIAERRVQRELSQLAEVSPKTRLQMAHLRLKMSAHPNSQAFWTSCCESLSTVLKNNQNTLESLIIEPFALPQLVEYPEMKAVKKLYLFNSSFKSYAIPDKTVKFFGENFDAAKTFPNLVEVTLDGKDYSLWEFCKFFPEDTFTKKSFQGVSSLRIKFKYSTEREALEKIANLFPDITSFFLDGDIDWLMSGLAEISRLWPKLISLKFKVDVTAPSCYTKIKEYLLDPVFTGIPDRKCAKLREHKEKLDVDLQSYRTNSGISTMTELTELTLIFYSKFALYGSIPKGIPFFSHVTPFYGFQCLPNLKVTCAIPWNSHEIDKIRRMLSQIEKHVIFEPNYYEPLDCFKKYLL